MIFTPWYAPAYKAGGPIQSCVRLVDHLKRDHTIQVLTGGYDLHQHDPLPGIELNQFIELADGVHIKYLSKDQFGVKTIKKELTGFSPDFIYVNGMFSKPFVIDVILAHRRLNHPSKIILAVHGACKPSALKHKRIKKKVFLTVVKFLGVQRRIKFHASNEEEEREIKNVFSQASTVVINTLPPLRDLRVSPLNKRAGQLNLIFIGRVHPIKNLRFIFEVLMDISSDILLKIMGPVDDQFYYEECLAYSKKLPSNVHVTFEGVVPHPQIHHVLEQAHLLILPTLGENYGYAIIEALSVGRPVLISDQTPWKNLEQSRAGWELPLHKTQQWIEALNQAADWDHSTFESWCQGALAYAEKNTNTEELAEKYNEMFRNQELGTRS